MKDELNQAQAIITLLKKNIVLIAIGVLLTLFYTVTIFLTPIVSQRLIDDVLAAVDAKRVYSGILFFVVVCTLQPFFSFFKELAFIHAAQRMLFDLRTQIFDKMLHLKYSLIEAGNSGDFISRITNDVGAISFFFTDVIAAVLNDVVLIVLIVIGMLMQSVSITIVITIGFFLFYLVNNYVSHKFEELSKISLENYDALFGSLTTTWRNIVLIKTYMLINSTLESFQGIINETKSIGIRFGKWSAMLSGVSGLIMVLSLAGIYSIGTLYIFNGTMTVGSVIALGLYFQLLSSPVMELNAVVVRYRETKPSIERITDYLNQDEEDFSLADGLADGLAAEAPPASQQAPASTPNEPAIEVSDVSYSYYDDEGKSNQVFTRASLHINRSGLYVIAGSSGSGKSTLLKLLIYLYDPDSGEILLNGSTASARTARELGSYVPQEPEMLNEALLYNLLLSKNANPDRFELTRQLAKYLLVNEMIESLPLGYETPISEIAGFSGGEKKRLALIRAILNDTPVLLLDEITSGLDAVSAERVISLLLRLSVDKTIIVATHDERLMDRANYVYEIQNGEIVGIDNNLNDR